MGVLYMKYEKALGKIVEFDNVDVIATSSDPSCNHKPGRNNFCTKGPGKTSDDFGFIVESEFDFPVVVEEEPTIIEE